MMGKKRISRMDRLEKNIELLFQGIVELRESQKETDKQIRESQKETYKQIRQSQKNIEQQIDRTQKQVDETSRTLNEMDVVELRESQKETYKQIRQSQKKIDRQIDRTQKQVDETSRTVSEMCIRVDKISRKLDAVGKQLGDMGIVQGEIGEDLFYRNVKYLFQKRGIEFETITRNLLKKGIAEYDIVAEKAGEVLVIEVKNKLTKRMINKFIDKKLPRFKTAFPEYQGYRVSGGVGSLVVKDDDSAYAEKKGLYVLTQRGDGGAMLTNRNNFKPKIFD